jgi:subtilisin family serine protease
MASGSIIPEGSNQSQKSAQKESERNRSLRLWTGVLVAAFVVGGGVWYWVNHHNPGPDQSQKTVDKNQSPDAVVSDNVDVSGDPRPADFVPHECIIQYKPEVTAEQKAATRARYKAELRQDLRYLGDITKADVEPGGTEVVTLDLGVQAQDMSPDERKKRDLAAIGKLSEDPNVLTAEPNYIIHKADDPHYANDTYYVQGRLWGMTTTGLPTPPSPKQGSLQKPGAKQPQGPPKLARAAANSSKHSNDASQGSNKAASAASSPCLMGGPVRSSFSAHADKAWLAGHVGSSKVLVGVVDSGIQPNHPDLGTNVSKTLGRDFYHEPDKEELFSNDEDPHGTHVAGIIAAVGGNKIGVAGVVWNSTLVEAKFLGPDGSGDTANAINAITYLTYQKAVKGKNIVAINASWASSHRSPALLNAIKEAGKANILLVAAAGNDHFDTDGKYKSYPADYDTSHDTYDDHPVLGYNTVISVAAIGVDGSLASFSNYGAHSVHIAAPGVDILSTWTGSSYKCDSGTSMAAPFVTGAVALYASSHPQAGAQEIRKAILSSVTPDPALKGKVESGGTLNLSTF